jgi:hypothetical protein
LADGFAIDMSSFLRDLNSTLQKADLLTKSVVSAALYEHMTGVMAEAKELCPVESGDLQGSGRVNKATIKSGEISIVLDFGVEPFIFYAADQHENLLYAHKPGKSAKFLEIPVLNWVNGDGPQRVMDDVENYLGREIFV